jgi:hypothetical protein
MKSWLVVAVLVVPAGAIADHRLAIEPSIVITEVHDDNLNLSAEEPLSDQIRRITPTLALRFDSPRWAVKGSYGLDNEQFAAHSAFDNSRARQRGIMTIEYQAGPRLTVSMNSAYTDTNSLAELNVDTGLAASRVRGRELRVGPSARFRLSPQITASASASSVSTNVENGIGMRAQAETIAVERRFTPRDLFRVDYEHSHIVFDGEPTQSLNSHVVLAGWSHDLAAHAHLTLRTGPRITDGDAATDLFASLTQDWRFSSIALSAQRSQTTVIGYAGAVDSRSLQAKFAYTPNRVLTAYATPAVIRSTRGPLDGTVYRLVLGARYAITPLMGIDVAYNRDLQNGAIDPLLASARFSHATLSIGFTTRWSNGDLR